jgi:hypothetical protein
MTPLKNAFTLYFYAFKINSGSVLNDLVAGGNNIWAPSQAGPEKNYFFSHVQDFFSKNNSGSEMAVDPSCCLLYELKKDQPSEKQKEKLFLLTQLFNRNANTAGSETTVNFKFILDLSVLSPRIFYHPLTNICILSYAIELSQESRTLENLVEVNYSLRGFGGSSTNSVFKILKNDHPKAAGQEEKISKILLTLQKNKPAGVDDQFHSWDLENFISLLLQDFPENSYRSLSPRRLQAFTYAQTNKKISEEKMNEASFRLRRIYNRQYHPGKDYMKTTHEVYQEFEQIHVGASIEGCAVIVNDDYEDLPEFLKQYDIVVKKRLVWTYLLAYFQRLAFIDMNSGLSSLYEKGQPAKEVLMAAISDLSRIQLRSFFAQVSYYSQHNEFYDFCKHNLKLNIMFADVKEKLNDVNLILRQQLSEAEKVKEKKREKKDRILEVMIAALLIPEIIFHFLGTLAHSFGIEFFVHEHTAANYVILLLCSILLLTIIPFGFRIYKEYFHIIRSYFTKEEVSEDIGFKKTFVE